MSEISTKNLELVKQIVSEVDQEIDHVLDSLDADLSLISFSETKLIYDKLLAIKHLVESSFVSLRKHKAVINAALAAQN